MPRSCSRAIAGYDPRDPFSLDDPTDFTGAVRAPDQGHADRLHADYDVFPIDRRIAAVVDEAVQAFERGGRARRGGARSGLQRDQRELSDLWCRLIMPINVATIEG